MKQAGGYFAACFLSMAVIIAGFAIWGCGSAGGDDPMPILPGSYGTITGQVSATGEIASVKAVNASILANTIDFASTCVYLESKPEIATYANSDGRFTLSPVDLNKTYNVIAALRSASGTYKVRSKDITVTAQNPAPNIGTVYLKPATKQIRIAVSDIAGGKIATAALLVWGEPFTYAGGYYVSPLLPAGETATVTISAQGFAQQPVVVNSDADNIYEISLPPAGMTNKSPMVSLIASRTEVVNGDTLSLTAKAQDPEGTTLTYTWEATAGSISYSGSSASWIAPASGEGEAEISCTVTDAGGLFAKAYLKINYGTSKAPIVEIISTFTQILTGTRALLTASATSAASDGLPFTYSWTSPYGTECFGTPNASSTLWKAPSVNVPTTTGVWVTVTDAKGRSATASRTFTIDLPTTYLYPSAAIVKPIDNQILPRGAVAFLGNVKLSDGSTLSPTYYVWYLQPDGESKIQIANATGSFNYSITEPGSYTVYLAATTSQNLGTEASVKFRINAPPTTPEITLSPNKTSFSASEAVTLTASSVDPEGQTISYSWSDYSYDLNATSTLGTGNKIKDYKNFTAGNHKITVLASDTLDGAAFKSVEISVAVNTLPVVTILEPSSSWYAVGETVPFDGYAQDAEDSGGYVATGSLSWTCLGPTNFNNTATSTFEHIFTNPGTHSISLKAIDSLGGEGSRTVSIYINATPTITLDAAPASGTRFDNGETFTLKATVGDSDNGDKLKIEWRDENTGNLLDSANLSGPWSKTHALSASLDSSGYHVIEAKVIDSCGVWAVATRSIFINTLPVPNLKINYPQYATAPGDIPVLLASPATQINLSAGGTDFEDGVLNANSISCVLKYPNNSVIQYASGVVSLPQFLSPGRYQMMVRAVDSLGSLGVATFTFVVWNAAAYLGPGPADDNLSAPTWIIYHTDGKYYIADHGNSKVKKFSTNFTLEAAIGGEGFVPGSFTSLVGLTAIGNKLYTLEMAPDSFARIQVWNGTASESNYGAYGTGDIDAALYNNPSALTTDGSKLFLSDTGCNRIQKLELTDGTADIIVPTPPDTSSGNDQTHFNNPLGIRYFNSYIYIADNGNGRIVERDNNLNYRREWNASAPLDIAKIGNYFVTIDRTGQRLQFWDSSGNFQMEAGRPGGVALGTFGEAVSIVVNGNSLAVLENGTSRVQIFTFPSANSPWNN